MLSAVAARKAARAAEASSSKPPSPPPLSRPRSPSPKPITAPKPASKRKPRRASLNTTSSKSKRVKVTHASLEKERNQRYFDTGDPSGGRNGALVADSNPQPEDNSESDSSSGEDIEIKVDVPLPDELSSLSVKAAKRAWSPSRPIPDSSEDENVGLSGSVSYAGTSALKKAELSLLSNFRPELNKNMFLVPENEYVTDGQARILVLHPNETLALVGTYSVCVLQGGLSLLGVTLWPSDTKHLVFAPRSSSIPILSWAPLDHQGSCTFPTPSPIRGQVNTTAILIEYTNTGVEGLGLICKVFDKVFKPPRESDAVADFDHPRLHLISNSTKSIHPFVLPASWDVAITSIDGLSDSGMSAAPVCLVKGSKKSGKSTLARTLVNRLLNRYQRVAFLECDLGQSEFTPGGLVALNLVENYVFGPPFTHASIPYRAHYIGSTSPRSSPSHYLCSIRSLLDTYRLDLQFPPPVDDALPTDQRIHDAIPLVVNTMGWTKGLGADLNARIEEFVEASHVFEIDEEKEPLAPVQAQHVPQTPAPMPYVYTGVTRHVKVEAIQIEMMNTNYTATDHRHLNILSYFHAVFPELPTSSLSRPLLRQFTATSWDTSLPLCARYPYEVDYTQAFDRAYLIGAGSEDVVPSEFTRVLNGAIVGLVSSSPINIFSRPVSSTSQEATLLSYAPGDAPPDPALSTCHGLALIRGLPLTLNPRAPHMHILTPVPVGVLSQTRMLVKGEMELPTWGMLDFREEDGKVAGIEKGHVPYLQWGKGEGVGGEKRRARRNLMRKGQM